MSPSSTLPTEVVAELPPGASPAPASVQPAVRNPRSAIGRLLLAAALLLAVVAAYQPAWRAGFVWDDDDYVTENPLLTAADGWRRIWFSTDAPSQYFPLTYSNFRVQHALWGLDPAGYHWVNILLHAANALLAWRLLARLAVPGAWLGAALFALHPVQVESVAWITELKNLQSFAFLLLALLAWVEFAAGRRGWGAYLLALVCHALALASKTTACTLPAALVLVLWWRQRPLTRVRWLQIAPFVALGLAAGLLTMWWERHEQGTDGSTFGLGPVERLLIATRAVWFYLGKFLWPADLAFSYPRWAVDAASPLAWLAPTALVAVAGAIAWARRTLGRGLETALVWLVALPLPLLGFVMLYTFRWSFVADHYVYAALLGPCALAGALLSRVSRRWSLRALGATAVLAALAFVTWRQAANYESRESLWRATLAVNPQSFLAHNNLAAELLEQGRVDEAGMHAAAALALQPTGPDLALTRINLGNVALRRGDAARALGHYRGAVAAQPDFADAHDNLGRALLDLGRVEDAVAEFRAALRLDPRQANAHRNLGDALYRTGDLAGAAANYERAAAFRPTDATLQNNLGSARLGLGRVDGARDAFEAAVRLDPRFAAAHRNLGFLHLQAGRAAAAAAEFRTALAVTPDDVRTLAALALLLSTSTEPPVRRGAEAFELAAQARTLAGERDALAWHAFAAAAAEIGRFREAVDAAERARALVDPATDAAFAALLDEQLRLHRAGAPLRLAP